MTPKELCDLAAKINAAVPGLVKRFETGFVDRTNVYVQICPSENEIHPIPDAAAMMTGRCAAWMEENMHDLMGPTRQTIVGAYRTLREYVTTTLPGAKQ